LLSAVAALLAPASLPAFIGLHYEYKLHFVLCVLCYVRAFLRMEIWVFRYSTNACDHPWTSINSNRIARSVNLKTTFPHASNSFLQANHQIADQIQPTVSQSSAKDALGSSVQRKEESLGRVTLSFRGYFVRLKDPDNFAGSLKNCVDAIRRCGLVDDDSPDKIKLICEQERVDHYAQERIELRMTWPFSNASPAPSLSVSKPNEVMKKD
jgi:hypothetical protein